VRHQRRRQSGGNLVGGAKRRRRGRGGTFIRACPAATTMEKATRTPAAPKMATVAGERWCAPERPTGHNRPTFLSPPARCQRRRGRVSKPWDLSELQ